MLEAIGPVKMTRLQDWVRQGEGADYAVYRAKGLSPAERLAMIEAGKRFLGLPYDVKYEFDDGKIYCSELLFKAYGAVRKGQELARVPRLDTAFGRGYGEEVDWCRRIRALGGRHLGLGNLFVEHRGAGSFGSADKARLVAANGAIISRRYPGYDAEVQRFVATDPLLTPRLALAVAWAAGAAGTAGAAGAGSRCRGGGGGARGRAGGGGIGCCRGAGRG